MARFDEYSCDRCDFCGQPVQGDVRRAYFLSTDEHVPFLTRGAWCEDCGAVVAAEWLLEKDVLESILDPARLGDPTETEPGRLRLILWSEVEEVFVPKGERLTEERFVRILTGMRKWRRQRQSPPRCLSCGGTRLRIFPDDGSGLLHPSCGGRIQLSLGGWCEPGEYFAELFAAEGQLLRRKRR
jgi:hypothetical protein